MRCLYKNTYALYPKSRLLQGSHLSIFWWDCGLFAWWCEGFGHCLNILILRAWSRQLWRAALPKCLWSSPGALPYSWSAMGCCTSCLFTELQEWTSLGVSSRQLEASGHGSAAQGLVTSVCLALALAVLSPPAMPLSHFQVGCPPVRKAGKATSHLRGHLFRSPSLYFP